MGEFANTLWKLVRRGQMTTEEGLAAATALEGSELELHPMRGLLAPATQLAVALDHPAYDAIYLALARSEARAFVTADERLTRKVAAAGIIGLPEVLTISQAAALVAAP